METPTPPDDASPGDPAERALLAHRLLLSLAAISEQTKVSRKERVKHVMFDSVFTQILRVHMTLPPGYVIVVIGCTGVGKTTLRNLLEEQLRNHFQANRTPEDEISVLAIDLKLEAEKGFIWRRFYIAQLRPLNEPMLEKKVDLDALLSRLPNSKLAPRSVPLEDEDVGILRDSVEEQFKARGVQFALVDELNLLGQNKSNGARRRPRPDGDLDLKLQMEILKSLAASVPETRYICFGTIEALPLLGLSSQLERRVAVIPFLDYSASTEDLQSFGNGVLGFLRLLPNGYDATVMAQLGTIRRATAGLFGVTVDWVLASNVDAMEVNSPLTWTHMERHMPNPSQTARLAEDVARIREYFRAPPSGGTNPNGATPRKRARGHGSRRRPGKRNPARDHGP